MAKAWSTLVGRVRGTRSKAAQAIPAPLGPHHSISLPPLIESPQANRNSVKCTWLQTPMAQRAMMIFLIGEGLYRIVGSGNTFLSSHRRLSLPQMSSLVFGIAEQVVAFSGLYLMNRHRKTRKLVHFYSAAFAILSIMLVPVIVVDVQSSLRRAGILHHECQASPTIFGSISSMEARRLCDMRVNVIRLITLSVALLRFAIQVVLIRAVYLFVHCALDEKQESFMMRAQNPRYEYPSLYPNVYGRSSQAAPAYQSNEHVQDIRDDGLEALNFVAAASAHLETSPGSSAEQVKDKLELSAHQRSS